MPAARPAANLLPAMELAAVLGCRLVVLCSGRTSVAEASGLVDEVPDLSCTLVDLHEGYRNDQLLPFGTGELPEAAAARLGDLSVKRNLGLLLARLVGWRSVLFLDDDIRDLSPSTVRLAASILRPGRATGMTVEDFPDNSVVCHALRLSGRAQDVFVSGAALAVDTTTVDSFFPEVYNEDWLFLYDRVRRGGVSATGTVRQAPYKPYATEARATSEEFGDVLGEGLLGLLHEKAPPERALQPAYWDLAIEQRAILLDDIAARLDGSDRRDAAVALAAVVAARAKLGTFDGSLFSMYVSRWRQDVRDWRKRLEGLPTLGALRPALDFLALTSVADTPVALATC